MQRKLKVRIDYSLLNTVGRKLKAQRLEKQMEVIFNSDLFKSKMLELNTFKRPIDGETSNWNSFTGEELYNYWMTGVEILDPEADGIVNLKLDDYLKKFSRVIGWTRKAIRTVYVNVKYFDVQSDKLSGSNCTHEYGHKKGFEHAFRVNVRTLRSICYQMNRIYEECYDEIIGNEVHVSPKKPGHYRRRNIISRGFRAIGRFFRRLF